MGSAGLGLGQVLSCSGHSNDPSVSIKEREVLRLPEELLAAQERLLYGISYLVSKLPPCLMSQSAGQSE